MIAVVTAPGPLEFAGHTPLAIGDSIDVSAGAEIEIVPLATRGAVSILNAGTASRVDHAALGAEVRAARFRDASAATLGASIYRALTGDETTAITAALDAADAAALSTLEGLAT